MKGEMTLDEARMRHGWERLCRFFPVVLVATAACNRAEPSKLTTGDASSGVGPGEGGATAPYSFPVPKATVDAVLNPEGLPVYEGPTGSVEGTIYVTGPAAPDVSIDARPCPAAIDTYGKQFRSGTPAKPDGPRPLADAVVVVIGYTGFYLPEQKEAKRVTIGTNCGYPTRAITMTFGQRLEVLNASSTPFAPVLDNDFSPAVMMAPPGLAGDAVRIYPRKPGYVSISDRMQSFVREDLYVFRHPLHTESTLDGHYRVDGLPVGKLTVGARHPGVGSESQATVDVIANVVRTVDLTLTYAPKAPQKPFAHVIP
jgi:hypothetical protein